MQRCYNFIRRKTINITKTQRQFNVSLLSAEMDDLIKLDFSIGFNNKELL